MATVTAFRGICYDPDRVGDLSHVVAPPYDVISPREQDALYARHPMNCVRIILNRAEPGDASPAALYERASACLREWLAAGVLREEETPALWVYRQDFPHPITGASAARTGVICALGLEPYERGIVVPHEQTRVRAIADRLELMRATSANTEPIYGLYEDDGAIDALREAAGARGPDLSVQDGEERHQVWRVTDPSARAAFAESLRDRRVWIADGHHRYETALAYCAERAAAGRGCGACASILAVLVPFGDPGIVILPTHRMVRSVAPQTLVDLPNLLGRWFAVERVDGEPWPLVLRKGGHERSIGMVTRDGAFLLTLRDTEAMDAEAADKPPVWRRLCVAVLQRLVLERTLGIPASAIATTPHIGYTRDHTEALGAVHRGDWDVAFLLGLPDAADVRDVSAAGERMPPKSTYFYPKLLSGLLLRRLED
ncbi:MAG TPA: DUF1015 domain-containing protein [Chthonomonadales bacterium]|nr:DUF1015 domain-containing protein [Chthonomonadales bacterium]